MLWIIQNQLSRRNLNDFQRVEMVRKCEEAVKAQAEKRMLAGKSNPVINLSQGIGAEKRQKSTRFGGVGNFSHTGGKSDPSIKLRKGRATNELGDMAGVSRKTYEHATAIIDKAPEAVTNAVRKNSRKSQTVSNIKTAF